MSLQRALDETRTGDIWLFRGSSGPDRAIQTMSNAPVNHVGMTVAIDDLPPLHGGLVGYLGYDIVREVERLPDVPPDDLGNPDAVLSVIGDLAAYDHFRQRVTLVANSVVSLYYYAKVVKVMFLDTPEAGDNAVALGCNHYALLIPLTVLTIVLGLYFQPLVQYAALSLQFFVK